MEQASISVCSRPTRRESSCACSMNPDVTKSSESSCRNSPTKSGTATSKICTPARCTATVSTDRISRKPDTGSTPTSCCSIPSLEPRRIARVERCVFRLHHWCRGRRPVVRLARQRAVCSEGGRGRSRRSTARRGAPAHVPWDETIVYELHVGGYTKRRSDLPGRARHLGGTRQPDGHRATSSRSASPASN